MLDDIDWNICLGIVVKLGCFDLRQAHAGTESGRKGAIRGLETKYIYTYFIRSRIYFVYDDHHLRQACTCRRSKHPSLTTMPKHMLHTMSSSIRHLNLSFVATCLTICLQLLAHMFCIRCTCLATLPANKSFLHFCYHFVKHRKLQKLQHCPQLFFFYFLPPASSTPQEERR